MFVFSHFFIYVSTYLYLLVIKIQTMKLMIDSGINAILISSLQKNIDDRQELYRIEVRTLMLQY